MINKKYFILFLLCILIIPIFTFADENDTENYSDVNRKGKVTLTSNSEVNNFTINCIPDYGAGVADEKNNIPACRGTGVDYYAATFEVDLGAKNGTKYWGYCMDPGYGFSQPTQGVTCTKADNSYMQYLADAAGSSHKKGSDDAAIYELALRIMGIENSISNSSVDKEVGRGISQAISYLSETKAYREQACSACGVTCAGLDNAVSGTGLQEKHDCVNSNYQQILVEHGLDSLSIESFIQGEQANLFSKALHILEQIKAGKLKGASDYSGSEPDIELDLENIQCANSGTVISIPIKKNKKLGDKDIIWTSNAIFGKKGSGYVRDDGRFLFISIPADSTYDCDENGGSIVVHASYLGGIDGDSYVCRPNGGNQQQIFVYTGSNSVVPGSSNDGENESSNSWTIPIPSCMKELLKSCKACSQTPVTVKTQGGSPNCCGPNGASGTVQDTADGAFKIDNIFDKNDDLKLEYQKIKCEAISATKAPDFNASNPNTDTSVMQKYCTMYCMETSSAKIPGPVEVTSGRYFKLPISSEMKVSEQRDCRIQVKFDHFLDDYKKIIDLEISSYNSFQTNAAKFELYDEAYNRFINGKSKTTTEINYKCTRPELICKYNCKTSIGTKEEICTEVIYDEAIKNVKGSISYYLIDYKKINTSNYPYVTVKLDTDYGENENNTKFLIVKDKEHYAEWKRKSKDSPYWTTDVSENTANVTYAEATDYVRCGYDAKNSGELSKYSCEVDDYKYTEIMDNRYNNFVNDRNNYNKFTNEAIEQVKGYAEQLKKMEESMDECEHYFTNGDGAKVGNHYKININANLSYDLVYNKDNGDVFAYTSNGKISSNCGMGVSEIGERGYSSVWGSSHTIRLHDFSDTAVFNYKVNKTDFKVYLDDLKNLDKSFKVTGSYTGGCTFNDDVNTYNTLFAGGLASPILTPSNNYTKHSKVYQAPLTNYTGRMEIRYQMGGFGSQVMRNFDSQFLAGSTCSGLSGPGTGSPFSCYYDSKQRLVTTGRCRDGKVISVGNYMYNCGPYCAGNDCDKIYNFNFKTVDPSLLFPNGTQNGRYAKNWVLTKEGKITQYTIEHEDTFNPSNLTYSFSFTSNDLNLIKKYNEAQVSLGGYSDFTLVCSCGTNSNGKTTGSEVCHECKSKFLDKLYDNEIVIHGSTRKLTIGKSWGNNDYTLTQVRRDNHWSRDISPDYPR